MPLGDQSYIGNIGSGAFSPVGADLGILLDLHGVTVQVTRHNTGPTAARDIYLEPLDDPAPFPVTLLLTRQELKEASTLGGGKRNEELTFIGVPGTLIENDILAFRDNNYDVVHVGKTTVHSADALDVYTATREVAV